MICFHGKNSNCWLQNSPLCSRIDMLAQTAPQVEDSDQRCYRLEMPPIRNLECSRCAEKISAEMPQTVCPKCTGALYVRYNLGGLQGAANRDEIARDAAIGGWAGMWRY